MTATARWAPPTAGIAAAAIAVGLGELSAAIIAPQSSPLTVVGATLIQLAPPWGVDAAIALFGSADKVALAIGIIVVLLVVAAGLGVLEHRRAPLGAVIAAALGGGVAVLAMTRPAAGPPAWAPSLLAAAAAFAGLRLLTSRLRSALEIEASSPEHRAAVAAWSTPPPGAATARRQFLIGAGAAVALGVLASIGAAASACQARSASCA